MVDQSQRYNGEMHVRYIASNQASIINHACCLVGIAVSASLMRCETVILGLSTQRTHVTVIPDTEAYIVRGSAIYWFLRRSD